MQAAEQQARELQPAQQRAAVLEAEKAALQRELEVAQSHARELLNTAREDASKTAHREAIRVPAAVLRCLLSAYACCLPPHSC